MPIGRIVTLWTGSAWGSTAARDRVAGLVVGDGLLLAVGERHRLAPGAHEHAVARHLEVVHVDLLVAGAHREQRGLVDEVGEVGAGHAGRAAGDDLEVDVGRQALRLGVDPEDRGRAR